MCIERECFEDFAEKVYEDMSVRVGEEYEVIQRDVLKNNNTLRTGIAIQRKDAKGGELCPTIYIEELYEKYCSGTQYEDILAQIELIHLEVQKEMGCNLLWLTDYEEVKDKLCFYLISKEPNRLMLRDKPHRYFHDMAVIYYVLLENTSQGITTAPVDNRLLDMWEKSETDLWERAYENTRQLNKRQFMSMKDKLELLLGASDLDNVQNAYVLDSVQHAYGAAHIIYADVIKRMAEELGEDLYLFPLSIHEWFVVKASEIGTLQDMNEMAKEFFEWHQEAEEELLTKHAYHYSKETGSITY